MWTTKVKTSPVVVARSAFVQLTVPLAPTAGVVHDQPTGLETETKVKPAGKTSFIAALLALSGPEFVTVIV